MNTIVDQIYLINLDRDENRLVEFTSLMYKLNWKFTRFPGIIGKDLIYKQICEVISEEERILLDKNLQLKARYVAKIANLKGSEIGCLLSHVSLWEKFANNEHYKRIAIFEDDARTQLDGITIERLLDDFYRYLSNNNIEEPDILYMGKALDDCLSYKRVWGNIYQTIHPVCLHAYIITKKGAEKLLSLAPYQNPIDMIPIKAIEMRKLKAMTFHPSIFYQDILNNVSNLRESELTIHHTMECFVLTEHVNAWHFMIFLLLLLVVMIILFFISLEY